MCHHARLSPFSDVTVLLRHLQICRNLTVSELVMLIVQFPEWPVVLQSRNLLSVSWYSFVLSD